MAGNLPEDLRNQRIISTRAACELIGVSQDTLQRLHEDHDFPARYRVGARRFGYRVADLQRWLKLRAETTAA